ncbi:MULTISPECIES: sensor histidine kinase [Mesonia]|uniref:Sensor protein ZraS n=1 Tax=Mesonia oceanica TaxID=2687242 RepID=A0AC61Y3A8_9FLAO|nr:MULTISPECIES: ATP-binding protein [Mesonia]MAN28668.1 two-component sensor histidine kinase [Mesonia sp.]MAQ41349.1 two-component sensor histidine kinase [Mesonia sp.]MBJ97448.1 two-component sensor histidine kinase [Flavobacteriaceae bacterium]VVU98922.1 Sensor protein ZraS [Mesonia oceanica]
MKFFTRSLRTRIFFSMIFLVLGASILIAGVTIIQYKDEARAYQKDKLKRKEASIRASINYEIKNTTYPVDTEHIPLIFKDKIYELQNIHGTEINIYDLKGNLLKSSKATFFRDSLSTRMSKEALEGLENSQSNRFVQYHFGGEGGDYQSSYSYITDQYFKPLAILNLPHIEDDGFVDTQLKSFLSILGQVYIVMIIAAILLSYFLSKYITSSLKAVSEKILATRLDRKNKKIKLKDTSVEIRSLIKAYNSMIDELEESAVKLARSEREQAWREMAKQVAHEIKNPLTPMRLSVQSFERRFDPDDPDFKQKLKEFSSTLIQQIDTMSSIASAFSNFAKMPAQQNEELNVPKIVKLGLDIFNEDYIYFETERDEILAKFDRTQLIRVVTNLVKNAIQASEEKENPKIEVAVKTDGSNVVILVKDNGHGISEENKPRIFEPKFTTKSSGMGLGLGIIKTIIEAFQGSINFTSEEGEGTTFIVKFPKK